MPVRKPVPAPPFSVARASHIEYGATDLPRAKAYWVDALGYLLAAETKDALYLRGLEERNHHSVVLRQSRDAHVKALGFKLSSEEELDKAARFFGEKQLPHRFVEKPFQGRTLAATDPLGLPLELYACMDRLPSMLQRYAAYRGAKIQRIDHINCFTPDVQASHDFYNEIGFRTTEYTAAEGTGELWAVWMHRKGGVHDIAFTNGVGPRLHHIGVWVSSVTDIIHICDVLATSGFLKSMERGPGRHGISNAFFLYLRDPDGHRIELFNSDYLTVDHDHEPIHWDLLDPTRQTLWGAPAPRSWFEEGTLFAGLPTREAVLQAQPIVAP